MFNKLIAVVFLTAFSVAAWAIPVNINKADAQTIANSLKNVGLVKAQAVVEYREQNGNFASADDLAKVKGIGMKTVELNRADILLDE